MATGESHGMTFAMVIRPTRATFPAHASEEELELVGLHFQYIKARFDAGLVRFVGRCADATFGIVIFDAEDRPGAQRFAESDPAVAGGLFSLELREFLPILPPAG